MFCKSFLCACALFLDAARGYKSAHAHDVLASNALQCESLIILGKMQYYSLLMCIIWLFGSGESYTCSAPEYLSHDGGRSTASI